MKTTLILTAAAGIMFGAAANANTAQTVTNQCIAETRSAGTFSVSNSGDVPVVSPSDGATALGARNVNDCILDKYRVQKLERSLLVRVSQNVLTCPTTAVFNVLPADGEQWFPLGRKVSYFGDGHQFTAERFGKRCWVIPILSGEFIIERRCGWADGLMGGNLWFFGSTADGALDAAERASLAAATVPGVSLPFPGGVAASGSKAGSRYKFSIASTYAEYCPTLKGKEGIASRLPDGVVSVQEIIINGPDLATISQATQAAIRACVDTPGLQRISAGNYGGRLGKSFVYLLPDRQPAT